MESDIYVEKPKDWQINNKEIWIDNVFNALCSFIENPNFETKEILMSLCIQNDINEFSLMGVFRNSKFELAMFNEIYKLSTLIHYNSAKIFIYRCLYEIVVSNKCMSMIPGNKNLPIDGYEYLTPCLKLFYITYYKTRQFKERTFVDELLNTVNTYQQNPENEIEDILYALLFLVYDLSFNRTKNIFPILDWDKKDIKKIFSKIVEMTNKAKINPIERPFKGMFKLALTNFILRSRDGDGEYLYQCISNETSNASLKNKEIWMRNIKSLNDKREEVAISSLFVDKHWIKKRWAKNVKLKPHRTCYVSCFSNVRPSKRMQKEYGSNIYGYKSERISDVLSPIWISDNGCPKFAYVASFNVKYEQKSLKDELNFLISLIDEFNISDTDKNKLYNEFLQYWLLSFKDKKWSHEREKRFQLFLYPDDYNYIDYKIEGRFLKLKSTIYSYPDFVLDNLNQKTLKENIIKKISAISARECLFCDDCLQVSYSDVLDKNKICKICGSSNIGIFRKRK